MTAMITASMLYDLVACPHRVTMDLFGDLAEVSHCLHDRCAYNAASRQPNQGIMIYPVRATIF